MSAQQEAHSPLALAKSRPTAAVTTRLSSINARGLAHLAKQATVAASVNNTPTSVLNLPAKNTKHDVATMTGHSIVKSNKTNHTAAAPPASQAAWYRMREKQQRMQGERIIAAHLHDANAKLARIIQHVADESRQQIQESTCRHLDDFKTLIVSSIKETRHKYELLEVAKAREETRIMASVGQVMAEGIQRLQAYVDASLNQQSDKSRVHMEETITRQIAQHASSTAKHLEQTLADTVASLTQTQAPDEEEAYDGGNVQAVLNTSTSPSIQEIKAALDDTCRTWFDKAVSTGLFVVRTPDKTITELSTTFETTNGSSTPIEEKDAAADDGTTNHHHISLSDKREDIKPLAEIQGGLSSDNTLKGANLNDTAPTDDGITSSVIQANKYTGDSPLTMHTLADGGSVTLVMPTTRVLCDSIVASSQVRIEQARTVQVRLTHINHAIPFGRNPNDDATNDGYIPPASVLAAISVLRHEFYCEEMQQWIILCDMPVPSPETIHGWAMAASSPK